MDTRLEIEHVDGSIRGPNQGEGATLRNGHSLLYE